MKLIALTSWYNEPVEQLERSVNDAIDCGVTHYVALDGRYSAFPGADRSDEAQALAIRGVCESRDVPCLVDWLEPSTEPVKRTRLFDMASEWLELGSDDWLFVHDADHTITRRCNLRPLLARSRADCWDAYIVEHDEGRFDRTTHRRFARTTFRAGMGLHVDPTSHWTYLDADGRIVWGFNSIPSAGVLPIVIHNFSTARTEERVSARDAYYDVRTEDGLEPLLAPTACFYCAAAPVAQVNADIEFWKLPDDTWDITHRRTLFVCADHLHKQKVRNTRSLERTAHDALRDRPWLKQELDAALRRAADAKARAAA